MKPIGLFETPDNEKALVKYIALFNGDDALAASLGYSYWKKLCTNSWIETEKLFVDNIIPKSSMIVAITVAGMKWNLTCKEANTNLTYRKIWIQGEQLKDEADVIK